MEMKPTAEASRKKKIPKKKRTAAEPSNGSPVAVAAAPARGAPAHGTAEPSNGSPVAAAPARGAPAHGAAEPSKGSPVAAAPARGPPAHGAAPARGAPAHGAAGLGAAGVWSSGLYDCFDDCGLCCLTFCCPCITFGKVAEIVDKGSTSCGTAGALYVLLAGLAGCQWIYSCSYRSKLRAQYALPDAPCCDCCVHFCCAPCALVQEYKELKTRGYDPDIGWQMNVQRGNGGPANAPRMQQMGR